MGSSTQRLLISALVSFSAASAASLSSVCTTDYVSSALPSTDSFVPEGITIDSTSVAASLFTNYSVTDATFWPDSVVEFCEVSFAYSHENLDDQLVVTYYMPSPDAFANRFLATGGAAYTINNGSGGADMTGGVSLGAVAGYTDGGMPYYGGTNFDDVVLLGNGTVNWPMVYNWGYRAIAEMTQIGKVFTSNFYGTTSTNSSAAGSKLYTYYTGCSEGGREGMSQVQRAPELYDGIIAGAPAMRYAHQQLNHLVAPVQVETVGYYPSTCEFDTILNATIAACDSLDGKADGVVARSDLCSLNFNISSLIGTAYSCAAGSSTSLGLGYGKRNAKRQTTTTTPAVNGTISEEAILVATTILGGLKDSQGRQVYLPFQPAAGFGDPTIYDSDTATWTITNPDTNGEWVTKFLNWQDIDALDLTNVTYDNLRDWMIKGMELYTDSLQTTLPDLTPFFEKGGRLLHYHGEADTSIPPVSSIRYHESVRSIMYPDMSFEEGNEALNEWYRFYLVPGAAHCATNDLQPNAPFPQDNFATMIQWVEEGIAPTTLNATVLDGDSVGEVDQLCVWPSRPYWTDNSTMQCQSNQSSISTLLYNLNAFKMPIY